MTSVFEKILRTLAIVVLAFEMPVPLYWLLLHGPVSFWRRHLRAAFPLAVLAAWGMVDFLLYRFRAEFFRSQISLAPALLGILMIALDVFTFSGSEAALGSRRIVGHAELTGARELIARGLYARVRHPRYLGMMAGVLGACLIVALPALWLAGFVWFLLALLSIGAEERELRARLGPAYAAYAEHVPALLPFQLRARKIRASPRREP